VAVFAPTVLRFLDPQALPLSSFGYAETATHLRFDGLAMGLVLAYLKTFQIEYWILLKRFSKRSCLLVVGSLLTVPMWSPEVTYYFGYFWVSVVCTLTLAAVVDEKPSAIAELSLTARLATYSYSIYLTHALVIHASVWATDKIGISRYLLVPAWVAAIFFFGLAVYSLIERPSLRWRDAVLPK